MAGDAFGFTLGFSPSTFSTTLASMTPNERWAKLIELDEELLIGGVILSEWCCFIVREADAAFASGANLASILTALSGIETYLRSEYSTTGKERLVELINSASVDESLKSDLHRLRKYRNKSVHVDEPWNDNFIIQNPERMESELEEMALFSARLLRRTIYDSQWI